MNETRALPEISASKCVHSALTEAFCSSCADACPRQAIVLDDNSLGLQQESCDGCGVCVTACPMGAIEINRGSITLAGEEQNLTAYIVCRNSCASTDHTVSCINALGIADLESLYLRGVRHLLVHEDCATCTIEQSSGLVKIHSQFSTLLSSRDFERLDLEFVPAYEWANRISPVLNAIDTPTDGSRRSLFVRLLSVPDKSSQHEIQLSTNYDEVLPSHSAGAVHQFVPGIDTLLCTGCDACVRICPTDALTLINSEEETECYVILASSCTGCGLCTDVCDQYAVTVEPMQVQQQFEIALKSIRCRHCGVSFRSTIDNTADSSLCSICRHSNHISNLFQVLE